MEITINGVTFSRLRSLNIKRELRRTEIKYNTKGDMLIDLVNRKYLLEADFGLLTESEMKTLRELSAEIFVSVTFNAPEGVVTEDFHISDEPAPAVTTVNGITMYGGVRLVLKQK